MPMTPPQVRLPISLPSPSVLKRYGKISPSDAENSLINVTIGPVNVCGGSVCGMPLRAIPTITSARPGIGRLGIHAQDYLFAGGADERVIKVWQARHRRVVDRENVIARFHVYADICERRARVLVPIFAR